MKAARGGGRIQLIDEASEAIEAMLVYGSVEDLLRLARANAEVLAEEELAVESSRPTCPIFQNEPWS